MAEQSDADYNIPIKGKALLSFKELFLEASAAAESYYFILPYHKFLFAQSLTDIVKNLSVVLKPEGALDGVVKAFELLGKT